MIIQLIIVLEFKKKKTAQICPECLGWGGGSHSAVLFSFSQFTFHKNQSLTIPVKSLSSLHPNAPLRQAFFCVHFPSGQKLRKHHLKFFPLLKKWISCHYFILLLCLRENIPTRSRKRSLLSESQAASVH